MSLHKKLPGHASGAACGRQRIGRPRASCRSGTAVRAPSVPSARRTIRHHKVGQRPVGQLVTGHCIGQDLAVAVRIHLQLPLVASDFKHVAGGRGRRRAEEGRRAVSEGREESGGRCASVSWRERERGSDVVVHTQR
eukprot:1568918-Rhodomonas_salina.2